MEHIEAFARLSVLRGAGFGLLAIVCFMFGLAGMPALSLKTGGVLCLLASFILILRAELADKRPYKRTEVWLMLDERARPPEAVAQQLIGGILRGVYQEFALHFARAAALALGVSLLINLLG